MDDGKAAEWDRLLRDLIDAIGDDEVRKVAGDIEWSRLVGDAAVLLVAESADSELFDATERLLLSVAGPGLRLVSEDGTPPTRPTIAAPGGRMFEAAPGDELAPWQSDAALAYSYLLGALGSVQRANPEGAMKHGVLLGFYFGRVVGVVVEARARKNRRSRQGKAKGFRGVFKKVQAQDCAAELFEKIKRRPGPLEPYKAAGEIAVEIGARFKTKKNPDPKTVLKVLESKGLWSPDDSPP